MNAASSNRFLKIVIILLIIINAVVIFLHFKPLAGGQNHHPRPHGKQLKFHLIHELKMDEKQENLYSEMVDRHRAKMNEIKQKEEKTRTELYTDLGDTKKNRINSFDALAALKREKEVVTFEHFLELRAILNPEQAIKFDEIIGEAVNGMEGPPGKGPK